MLQAAPGGRYVHLACARTLSCCAAWAGRRLLRARADGAARRPAGERASPRTACSRLDEEECLAACDKAPRGVPVELLAVLRPASTEDGCAELDRIEPPRAASVPAPRPGAAVPGHALRERARAILAGLAARPGRRARWLSSSRVLTARWGDPEAVAHRRLPRAPGGYQALRKALAHGPRRRHRGGQGLRAARPGRRRASRPGTKWSFIPQDTGKPMYVVVQLRRERAGHLQQPRAGRARPAPAARGHRSSRVRDRVPHRLHLLPRRVRVAGHRARAGRRARPTTRGTSGRDIAGQRVRPRHRAAPRRRRLHLRRGDGAAGVAGGLPRPAPAAPAVPGRRGPVRVADRDQQRGDALATCRTSSIAARSGSPRSGPEKSTGPEIFSISGKVDRPGNYEAPMGTPARELIEELRAAAIRDGKKLKAWTPGGSSTPFLTADHLDTPMDFDVVAGGRVAARDEGDDRAGRDATASSTPPCASPSSTRTSRAASARRAARARGG